MTKWIEVTRDDREMEALAKEYIKAWGGYQVEGLETYDELKQRIMEGEKC